MGCSFLSVNGTAPADLELGGDDFKVPFSSPAQVQRQTQAVQKQSQSGSIIYPGREIPIAITSLLGTMGGYIPFHKKLGCSVRFSWVALGLVKAGASEQISAIGRASARSLHCPCTIDCWCNWY